MPARSSAEWPRDIDRVRRRFEAWRNRRDPGTRIPASLWTAAVKLAQVHGVSAVSRSLRVDYYALQERLETATRARAWDGASVSRGAAAAGLGFVELPASLVAGVSPCVLELEDRRGGRLRLELRGLKVEELAALVRSVWNRRR